MTIVVHDANILIDLVKLQILPHFFALDFRFCTTDLVWFELHQKQQDELTPYIDKGNLEVIEITDKQLIEVVEITRGVSFLSEQDGSAFYQARELNAMLLTSDNKLRNFAKENDLEVHGHLWIFDRMVEAKTITGKKATEKLDELNQTINPTLGLPIEECAKRIKKWQRS